MTIERSENEIIIKIPASVSAEDLQHIVDYLAYKSITVKSKAFQKDADGLAKSLNKTWWLENKHKFIQP